MGGEGSVFEDGHAGVWEVNADSPQWKAPNVSCEISMPKARERFEPFVERRLAGFPEIVEPLMAAVDAFDAIDERGERSQANLDKLVLAASSSRGPLCENICPYMRVLSGKWPAVADAILEMSKSSKGHIRFNAIIVWGKRRQVISSTKFSRPV